MIGETIAHFEITAKIGEGGMGEVYQATDTKLNRKVALKILPQSFAQDPQRMGRFQREAQVLASLNHPNIAQIFGLESVSKSRREGLASRSLEVSSADQATRLEPQVDFETPGPRDHETHCLVMELVEGEDLSERIARGPIPVDEALPIALQIAEALEDAHEKGIIHRDLKPANIKLTPEGKVKILDFGLAKALEDPSSSTESNGLSRSPTLSIAATQAGIILGTPAYMSPEQARGKPVDRRADIWAFGVVLFEMLSGKQAFSGEDLSLTMANIMTMEPRWDVLPHALPRGVRRLLNRCLRKDPNTRLRDIGEARVEIEESPADPSEGTVRAIPATPESPPVWRRTLPWVVVGVFAIALVVTLLGDWVLSPQPVVRPLMRVALTLPSSQTLKGMGNSPTLGGSVVALSPDGTHLAYSTANRLYLRALDQLEAAPINGTKGGRAPFFSPDGQWMGFWADGELKKVSIRGGTPMTLCEARNPVGASWTPGDLILFAQGPEGIFQVPAAGGTKKLLVSVESGEVARSPQLLPGGEAVLFTLGTYGAVSDAQIVVQALETGERKILISAGIDGRYLPTGHLIFGRAGTLRAVAFGVESLEVRGNPVPVVEGVLSGSSVGSLAAQFSVSDFGLLAYVPGTNTSEENSLVWVDRDGAEEPIKVEPRSYGQARLSPDGRLLALEIEGDIWIYDLTRGTTTRVTFDGGSRAAWTPDGKRIVFTRPSGLFVVPIDGSSDAERLAENRQEIYHSNAVSPDGKTLLLHSHAVGRGENVLTLDLNGQREPQAWRASVFSTVATAFSPDGKWIVYVSNESGQDEIYVSPFPGPGGKTKVSTDGGTQPVWGANGEIFYRQDDRMMAVEIRTEPELTMGRPQELFEGQYGYGWWGPFPSYDATRDGRRFMMVKEARSKGGTRQEIVLVQNWFEELKHLVPRE